MSDPQDRPEHFPPDASAELVPTMPRAIASPTTPMGEWNVIVAQADTLANSDIVPSSYRRKPANIVAAALTGRTFGWDVMSAMRNGNVIEGTYAIKPEAQLGLVRAAGHSVSGEVTGTDVGSYRAVVMGKRRDNGDTMTVEWTLADAVAAGLCSIKDGQPYARSQRGSKLPWEQYPKAMLWARAVSVLCRELFSDVTLGLSYTLDEVTDGAFSEGPGGEAQVEQAARPAPPDGWADWAECDNAHDSYIERWRMADADVRTKITGYTKDAGYVRPMTKPQLEELEGQLDILIGAPTERVKPAGEGPEGADASADSTDTGSDVPKGSEAAASPEAVPSPAVTPDDEIEEAELVEEAPAPEPGVPAPPRGSGAGPEPGGDDDGGNVEPQESAGTAVEPTTAAAPAPPVEEPATRGEKARLATGCKSFYGPEKGNMARHALARIVSNGRTNTSTQLTGLEIRHAIAALRLLTGSYLAFVVADGDGRSVLPVGEVPGEDDPCSLTSAAPEGETDERGRAFIAELAAFIGGRVEENVAAES